MTIPSPTIGVCGFGRCGSTMVMAMLDAGGVKPVAGSAPLSYELPGLEALEGCDLAGKTVKLLDGIQYYDLPEATWRFIWLDRDVKQQAKSFVKFGSAVLGDLFQAGADVEAAIAESYVRDRPTTLAGYRARGLLLTLRYEDVLARPLTAAAQIRRTVAPQLDIERAASAVHVRTGECKPDLAFECSS